MNVQSVRLYSQSAPSPESWRINGSSTGGTPQKGHADAASACAPPSTAAPSAIATTTGRMVISSTVPRHFVQSQTPSGRYSQTTGRFDASFVAQSVSSLKRPARQPGVDGRPRNASFPGR